MSPKTSTALSTFSGSHREPGTIARILEKAAAEFNLVSPATSCGTLPEGCSVALSTVLIDSRLESKNNRQVSVSGEIYEVTGKWGLAKIALERIASAAGVSWDPVASRRLDDGSDPHYCLFQAVGTYTDFDGRERQIVGTKEMDLRIGSPQCLAIEDRARDDKGREKQIREMRLHLVGHAESKARLRAIRSLGIRPAYSLDDLRKPFVVAKLMFTGETNDPVLRHEFAILQAKALLGGRRTLYGEPSAPQLAPAPIRSPAVVPPPPVGQSYADDDPESSRRQPTTSAPAPEPSSARPAQRQAAPARDYDRETGEVKEEPRVRFSKYKDQPLSAQEDGFLTWYEKAVLKDIDNPERAQYRSANEAHLAEIRAEIAKRRGEPVPPPYPNTTGDGDDSIPF